MALPDISGLTEAELAELTRTASQRLNEIQNSEQTNRERLLDPAKITAEIATLKSMIVELDTWIASAPAGVNKQLAIGLRRTMVNTIRLIRVVAGRLESIDTGETL